MLRFRSCAVATLLIPQLMVGAGLQAANSAAAATRTWGSCTTLYPATVAPGTSRTFVTVRQLTINPGMRGTAHTHEANEYISVVSGHGVLVVNGHSAATLTSGTTLVARANTPHYAKNSSPTAPLVYLSFLVGGRGQSLDYMRKEAPLPGPQTCPRAAPRSHAPAKTPVGYCGAPADTRVIESRAAAADGTDTTAVMSILVVDGYARALVESKGEDTLYFANQNGSWALQGRTPPNNLPAGVSARFHAVAQSTTVCGNPHFVNHPSGR